MSKETPDDPTITNPEDSQNDEQAPTEEQPLSPEVIEKIMDKAQDIDSEGTAYRTLFYENIDETMDILASCLNSGILGTRFKYTDRNPTPESYALALKRSRKAADYPDKNISVNFNIVGRSETMRDDLESMQKSREESITHGKPYRHEDQLKSLEKEVVKYEKAVDMGLTFWSQGALREVINLIFDLSSYREQNDREKIRFDGKLKPHEYVNALGETNKVGGKQKVSSSWGFALYGRVAPRKFRGIFYSHPAMYTKEDIGITDQAIIQARVEEIVKRMYEVYKNKKELLLPIYNAQGDLIWPKQMSHGEVKKFVAEREVKKKPEAEKKED
jgi:hypothetical protein